MRYCGSFGPNVENKGNFSVHFVSGKRTTSSGAQCTVACMEASPPPPLPSPVCMMGYDSVCLSNKTTESRTAYCPFEVIRDFLN